MAEKIKALLPNWLTDPVAYIKGLVADMAALLPGMGGDKKVSEMSAEDKKSEIEDIKSKMASTQNAINNFNRVLAKKPGDMGYLKPGKSPRTQSEKRLAKAQADQAERQARLKELEGRRMGGPVKKGVPYLVGEGTVKPELFVPDSSGMILSAQRTEQILQAGLQRGAAGAGVGSPTIVSAPVTSINNSSSNMTNTTTSFNHPSAILNSVNLAA